MRTGPRREDEPELYGAKDAAEALGVAQSNLRTVKGLPKPYGRVTATTLWRKEEIDQLAERRRALRRISLKEANELTKNAQVPSKTTETEPDLTAGYTM